MSDNSNLYLILYITTWLFTFLFYQKKRRFFDAGSFILVSYLVYSIFSFFLFNGVGVYTIKSLSLFPFLYLYIMLMITTSPVLLFNTDKISSIKLSNQSIVYIILFSFAFFALLSFPDTIEHIREGVSLIMLDSMGGADLVAEAREVADSYGHGGLTHLPSVISNAFVNIGVFLLFYLLTLKNKPKLIISILVVSLLLSILSGIASGMRGRPINLVLTIVGTFFLFSRLYSDSINKWVRRLGIILIIIVAIPIVFITTSRFGEDNSFDSILDYAGQENLYFNKYGLDDNGIRYGDRTIPLFKRIIGIEGVPHNYIERRDKYPFLKINDEVFCTFVGDFTIDFGPILASAIFIIFNLFVVLKTKIKNGAIQFRHLLLIHFVMCVCVQGGMTLYSFADTAGNLQIIAYLLVYVYSKFSERRRAYVYLNHNVENPT